MLTLIMKVNFVKGALLYFEDIKKILTKKGENLNDSGKKMLENLQNMEPHNFEHIQQEFKVSHLQHVTNESSMKGICEQEFFRITTSSSCSGLQEFYGDLSFWTAIVATKDVTEAREESFVKAKEEIPWMSKEHEKKFRAQFANSPAFKHASRFGNFKFSFQLSDLLDLYQAQHCGDEEPQLRILGTDMYEQEVTHYILVHGPDKSYHFMYLPKVPTDREFGHSFAYLKNKTMYWIPESTSISLKLKISKYGPSPKTCYQNCDNYISTRTCVHTWDRNYKVPSVWNHLVIAFHLPNGVLKIPRKQLLKSLTTCNISDSPLLPEAEQLELNKAQEIVREMKSAYGRP